MLGKRVPPKSSMRPGGVTEYAGTLTHRSPCIAWMSALRDQVQFGSLGGRGSGLVMLAMACAASALETVEMTLRWNFLKLGTVTFEQEFKDNQQRFEIIGKTAGPLRLVKNYDGRGLLLRKGELMTTRWKEPMVASMKFVVLFLKRASCRKFCRLKTERRRHTWSRENLGVRVLFRRWL